MISVMDELSAGRRPQSLYRIVIHYTTYANSAQQ